LLADRKKPFPEAVAGLLSAGYTAESKTAHSGSFKQHTTSETQGSRFGNSWRKHWLRVLAEHTEICIFQSFFSENSHFLAYSRIARCLAATFPKQLPGSRLQSPAIHARDYGNRYVKKWLTVLVRMSNLNGIMMAS